MSFAPRWSKEAAELGLYLQIIQLQYAAGIIAVEDVRNATSHAAKKLQDIEDMSL